MRRTKNTAPKIVKKQKLTPQQRSDVAKARWAKRRKDEAPEIAGIGTNVYYAPPETGFPVQGFVENTPTPSTPMVETIVGLSVTSGQVPVIHTEMRPAPPQPPEQPSVAPESEVGVWLNEGDKVVGKVMSREEFAKLDHPVSIANPLPTSPSPQLSPAAPKKAKRYTGPKEFSVALKAAENRLAKAIVERAQAAGQLAALQAEIPSLVQIINALKGPQNIVPSPQPNFVPHDFAGHYFPNVLSGDMSVPPYVDPLAAIAGAAAAPPMSRASGGAIQFSPEVLGSLEGPDDDDDPDRYITGPLAGGGWK